MSRQRRSTLRPDSVDVFHRPDLETLEVYEQNVAFGIVADAIGQVSAQQRVIQAHRGVAENAWIHRPYITDQGFEIHLPKNVAIKINSGSDFDQVRVLLASVRVRNAQDIEQEDLPPVSA